MPINKQNAKAIQTAIVTLKSAALDTKPPKGTKEAMEAIHKQIDYDNDSPEEIGGKVGQLADLVKGLPGHIPSNTKGTTGAALVELYKTAKQAGAPVRTAPLPPPRKPADPAASRTGSSGKENQSQDALQKELQAKLQQRGQGPVTPVIKNK